MKVAGTVLSLAASLGLCVVSAWPAEAAGPWNVQASPSPSPSYNYLDGVTCVTATSCWAVGSYQVGSASGPYHALIERFDGSSWTVTASPARSGDWLYSVACVTAQSCWAVGDTLSGGVDTALIEHFDGTAWSRSSPPATSDADSALRGVACVTATDCWAAGLSFDTVPVAGVQSTGHMLLEHFDGIRWAVATVPALPAQLAVLQSVTCVSAADCWAAGYLDDGTVDTALFVHFDGTQWTSVTPPANLKEETFLYGVACAGASECWAVGFDYTQDVQIYQPVIERYDGTGWSVVTAPSPNSSATSQLWGITCRSASDCWAVGDFCTCSATYPALQTLLEHYDGTAWSIRARPPRNTATFGGSDLQAVTCPAGAGCTAVGYSWNRGVPSFRQRTLILRQAGAGAG